MTLSPPCQQSDGSLLFNECIRVVPDPQDLQFLTRAQQDLQKIASTQDPVGEVGSALVSNLIARLRALPGTIPIAEVRIQHGGVTVPAGRFKGFISPFTRPSPTGVSTNDDLVSITPVGSTVYDANGSPLLLAYITGTKGTGVGNGSTINYRPEDWPNLSVCASGLISDVGLVHELLHAYRFASATVDYQSFGWFTQDRDDFLTREEKWVVSKENRYRTLINDPNVKQRKTYKKDC